MVLEDWFDHEDKFTNASIYDVIADMAPSPSETIFRCMWKYKYEDCNKFFVPIFTDLGLCFAYNAINSRDIYTNELTLEI